MRKYVKAGGNKIKDKKCQETSKRLEIFKMSRRWNQEKKKKKMWGLKEEADKK